MIPSDFQLDLSELEGRRFVCEDPCKLCCLCQPECVGPEAEFFKKNHPKRVVLKREPHRHVAMALKKGQGSCTFLNKGRCEVYDNRPHFCRQFPFHVHVGTRVQVELDLSCRGVWSNKGEEATPVGLEMVQRNVPTITKALREAREVYHEFFLNCRDSGLDYDVQKVRKQVRGRYEEFGDLRFVAALLEASVEDEELDLAGVKAKAQLDRRSRDDLEHSAMEMALDSLNSDKVFESPVYCAEDGSWNVFRIANARLEHHVMGEEGDIDMVNDYDVSEVKLFEPVLQDRKLLVDYVRTLNERDSMMGTAFHLMDEYEYEDPLPNVYAGVMSTAVLDLLWRSAMLSKVFGHELGAKAVKEGVIYYDMDRLDAPGLGAFV